MRIVGKGLVERSKPVSFRFDGKAFSGFQGDTLASALLANGERLLGRSFKYHRPRGVLTVGSEEPNALVTLGHGSDQDPNRRATMVEIFEGLEARSQNAWPSLRRDVMAVNDLLSPFLSAGFYYKTFMWPRRFWESVYEPVIRRAAGLGALSGQPHGGEYEKAFAHCDLLVIGSGPAGLMAALTAARAGVDVILVEQDAGFGGRLTGEDLALGDMSGADWAAGIVAELRAMGNVRLMPRTCVTGVFDGGMYAALESVGHHMASAGRRPLECLWRITARRAILASGALERPIAFADNDRPGILLASAARTYLHRFGVAVGQKVAVFGNNDDAHRTARDLAAAGVEIAAVIDSRPDAQIQGDFPIFTGANVVATRGRLGLREITVQSAGGERKLEVDTLAMSGGWNPSLHLTCHLGACPVWNDQIHAFVPQPDAVPGLDVAGAALGSFSTKGALKSGVFRAKRALDALGVKVPRMSLPRAEDSRYDISPLWAVPGKGRAWLDFQNDVTTKDVAQSAREGFRSVEHMKRYTTQGMATDQGKSSNVNALAVLADVTGRSIPETGTTTFRPPFTPVSLAAMGAGARGKGFAPERLLTSHKAAVAAGAEMVEAGLWYRPSWFPIAGETNWRQSCDREVLMVRQAVGVCDVSSLGKIDIQGKDAAQFLDFVYTNTFSTLAVGRVRYGLMLREDGFVMDDGTCARLGADHFLMTTTTGAAAEVMAHLDFVRQALVPQMDVQMISVTEQWAQFAVAGPNARPLLDRVLERPLTPEKWPFMACGPVRIGGVEGRLFRISFSGEHAYELAVPARYGAGLWQALLDQVKALGGGPYGLEALNVLRIEKGLLTHAELDGRATAAALGLGRMMSGKKDFIGRAAAGRPGLTEAGQGELVGLKPVGAVKQLTNGAHLFAVGAKIAPENDEGHTTSTCFSPTLGHSIGLAFLKNGRARHGEQVQVVDEMRGIRSLCEVTDPVFFDAKGGRARD